LEAELSSEVGVVRVDPDRIQQVIWNLLSNAVKFTPEGGRVGVTLRRVDSTVEIEVKDTGVGIRPEFLQQVFDRFRQADAGATRRYAGLGLGLAIAKQLVELHGGTITARSDGPGCGATFTVYLPLQRREGISVGQQAALSEPHQSADLTGIEVVLVEDDKSSREATELLLRKAGAEVRAVESAAQARQAYAARLPDIIVSDVGMADEDGYALVESVRRLEKGAGAQRVPAIALTAFARTQDRLRALTAGFDEHLHKPVKPEQLIAVVIKLVRRSRSERQARST
jgi:CheY-like chemotaxis protein